MEKLEKSFPKLNSAHLAHMRAFANPFQFSGWYYELLEPPTGSETFIHYKEFNVSW